MLFFVLQITPVGVPAEVRLGHVHGLSYVARRFQLKTGNVTLEVLKSRSNAAGRAMARQCAETLEILVAQILPANPMPPAPDHEDLGWHEGINAGAKAIDAGYLRLLVEDGCLTFETDSFGGERAYVATLSSSTLVSNNRLLLAHAARRAGVRCWVEHPLPTPGTITVRLSDGTITTKCTFLPCGDVVQSEHVRAFERLTTARMLTLAGTAKRLVISLSGGTDSCAVAACAARLKLHDRTRLLHLAFPNGERAWETVTARSVARRTGLELHELHMRKDTLIREEDLPWDPARHPWFAWAFRWQRAAAALGDLNLTGRSGEWFGADSAANGLRALLQLRNLERISQVAQVVRPAELLRSLMSAYVRPPRPRTGAARPEPGACHLIANPYAGPTIPSVSAFETEGHYALAHRLRGTGLGYQKLIMRAAFVDGFSDHALRNPRVRTERRDLSSYRLFRQQHADRPSLHDACVQAILCYDAAPSAAPSSVSPPPDAVSATEIK